MTPYQLRYGYRYGHEIENNSYPTNEFVERIISRSTRREFIDKEIDERLLSKLFAAAQSSPTSSMFQTWSAIIVDKEHRYIFKEGDNALSLGITSNNSDPQNLQSLETCDKFIVWCVNMNTLEQIMELQLFNTDNDSSKKTILESLDSLDYSTYQVRSMCDAIIAAQTFCLSAESMGLGTVYMGSLKTMDLQKDLNLPNRVMPLFGICVGYPTVENNNILAIKPRLPQHLVVHRNTYTPPDDESLIEYNNIMKSFYERVGAILKTFTSLQPKDWFERIVVRTHINSNVGKYKKLMSKYGFNLK
jgi:nitroreductase